MNPKTLPFLYGSLAGLVVSAFIFPFHVTELQPYEVISEDCRTVIDQVSLLVDAQKNAKEKECGTSEECNKFKPYKDQYHSCKRYEQTAACDDEHRCMTLDDPYLYTLCDVVCDDTAGNCKEVVHPPSGMSTLPSNFDPYDTKMAGW